jgi:hypothetical protein
MCHSATFRHTIVKLRGTIDLDQRSAMWEWAIELSKSVKLTENPEEALLSGAGVSDTQQVASDPRRADNLRSEAARCRRLTSSVLDRKTIDTLSQLADEYEAEAERLSRVN